MRPAWFPGFLRGISGKVCALAKFCVHTGIYGDVFMRAEVRVRLVLLILGSRGLINHGFSAVIEGV